MATVEIITQLPVLPPRELDSNKGDFGRVLVVAGSRGMSGAAVLCGSAALRGGAGLVTVAVPEDTLPIVAAGNPCYLTAPLSNDREGKLANVTAKVLELAQANDVAAVGPGLGRSVQISKSISDLVSNIRIPLVLDADGINALVNQTDSLKNHSAPIILTPHPGEFARLLGCDVPTVQARRQELAVEFAAKFQVILVLKGHRTIVTDGRQVYQNQTGNPGMATGGTGDVLTGLIAALLGQKLAPFAAAQLGVYLHGLAGDLAQEELGQISLIASDLLAFLPKAFISYCSLTQRNA
ncbi:MAG TPA: NAD(P)H-hydrate dehydratase [Gemmataceae bacterium]|jgi:NAD(P)H-hydrate epimerase|nr:NAD(P)H-hydrate dehydratase [Gemmataceae bacterium]